MTNRDWIVEPDALRRALRVQSLSIVNDFAAAAAGLPTLDQHSAQTLREGASASGNLLLLGPGTGLGVAALLGAGSGEERIVASEAGHMGLAYHDAALEPLHATARARWGRMSWERLLSGEGLRWLYAWQTGSDAPPAAPEVSARAARGEAAALRAAGWFSRLLGACAGDLCLAFGADGGVWLSGGVLDGLGDAFDTNAFLDAFDDKGRYASRQRGVPVRRVLAADLAFRGLARIVDGACRAPGLYLGDSGSELRA
jgi:glucokinase